MPGDKSDDAKSNKSDDERKDDHKKEEDQKAKEKPAKKQVDKAAQKRINDVMKRIDQKLEKTDNNVTSNAKERQKEKQMLMNDIENMKKELDPYIEKDKEVLQQKVKVEVENALLVILDKKYKAEEEVEELKALLKDRNAKIYKLEQENKRLQQKNEELQDMLNGGTGRARKSQQEQYNVRSQDGDGFERAPDEPVYDMPPSQDDDDDFWQEGKAAKRGYGDNENDLWIMGNKDNLNPTNMNAYNTPGGAGSKAQPPGFGKSIPKRPQGYNANDDMAFYGVGVTGAGRKI